MGTRNGHAIGRTWRVHTAQDRGTLGIRDVDHLETGRGARDVGECGRDDHATAPIMRVHAAQDLGALGIDDVDDRETIPAHDVGVRARDGHERS